MAFLGKLDSQGSEKWLLWKITADGTYLSVIREEVPPNWNVKEIQKTLLDNKIVNFDINRIEQVIKEATGKEERIGEPFEIFEDGKRRYINLQTTPIQVRFSINASILKTDYKITLEDIYFLLKEKSVVYGIDHDILQEILEKEIYGQEFIIASATPPVRGKNAIVTELIPIDPDAKPLINEDGTADYKRWENIRQIKQGEVICSRVPPTPGIPGTSVLGTTLSPIPGEDFALPGGENTKEIDNETKLVAAESGFLYRRGREICVGSIYIVKSDVDFKTGNINYSGDVLIKGNVNSGFSVIAEGNISIEGFVESSNIESKKHSVTIRGSVFGQNNASIKAANNITAENIQDAKVSAGKKVSVRKLARGCHIETEDLIIGGQLVSCQVFFKGTVKCENIGGKVEAVNELTLIEHEREQFREEVQKISELVQKLNTAIDVLQTKIFAIKPGIATPELENQKKLFNSQLAACNSSREQLISKRKKLLRLIEMMPDKENLIIAVEMMPIVRLSVFGFQKEIKTELSKVKISWKSGEIRMEGI